MAKIAVVGAGYVGLTTSACLSYLGHQVVCADIDVDRVIALNKGRIPIVEEGLDDLVRTGLKSRLLQFVVGAGKAVYDAEFVFMCLPTPQGEDGSADLSYITSAAGDITSLLQPGAVVINKSTVPVGSAKLVKSIINRDDISVVSNPEFLREGSAVNDFLHPDRIVVGSEDRAAAEAVAALYSKIDSNVLIASAESAEMIKYCANSFLAMKLSFVNEVAALCEKLGADIFDVVSGVGFDRRIGKDFMSPGPGWGGSCFPKDTQALLKISSDVGHEFTLLAAAVDANTEQLERVFNKIKSAVGGSLSDKTVAVWGLTFKAGTDDLRDSPSIAIVSRLISAGARVQAYDPTIRSSKFGLPAEIKIASDAYSAAKGADVLAVLTEWSDFSWTDPYLVAEEMRDRQVVDARNVLHGARWVHAGFTYQGIGR
jgi:UDPglucose 6-dehydrogenase